MKKNKQRITANTVTEKKEVSVNKDKNFRNFLINNCTQITYALIFIAAFMLYGWTYTFSWGLDDGFIYDSLHNIENNWTDFSTIISQKLGEDYRPFTILTFWMEQLIFKELKPNISHLINVFIYALLLLQIFRFIVAGNYFVNKRKLYFFALIIVLYFLVHPIHVCVVANIKSRDNLLSMLLGLTGAIFFIQFLNNKKISYFILSIVILSLAVLSKMDAYAFVLFCLIYFLFYKATNLKQTFKMTGYLILIFIVVTNSREILLQIYVDKNLTQRMFVDSPLVGNDEFLNRISMSLTTMYNYFIFYALPVKSYAYYGVNQIQLLPLFSFINIFSFILHLSIFIFSIYKFRDNKMYLFSFLFYLLSIAYASNLPIVVSGILSERYNFIGSLGQTMFLAALIMDYFKLNDWKSKRNLLIFIPFVLLIAETINRTGYWKDTETLLLKDVRNNTNSAHAYLMLSSNYINAALFDNLAEDKQKEKFEAAEVYVDKGLSITKNNPFLIGNKGIIELAKGNNKGSISYFNKAYLLDTTLISNVNYIGIAYRNLNNMDSALYYFKTAMNKSSEFSYPANNYIEMLIRQQKFKAVDSTLLVLTEKYPNNKYLQTKIKYLREKGAWYAF